MEWYIPLCDQSILLQNSTELFSNALFVSFPYFGFWFAPPDYSDQAFFLWPFCPHQFISNAKREALLKEIDWDATKMLNLVGEKYIWLPWTNTTDKIWPFWYFHPHQFISNDKMQQKYWFRLVRNTLSCPRQIQLTKFDLSIFVSSSVMTRSLKRKTLLEEIDWDLCSLVKLFIIIVIVIIIISNDKRKNLIRVCDRLVFAA